MMRWFKAATAKLSRQNFMPRNECSFSFNIHRITAISASIHMANITPLPA
jgi:hypothetical protein